MPIDPDKLCVCHGEPMISFPSETKWRCRVKRRDSQRAAERRYFATPNGKARKRIKNQRRVRVDGDLVRMFKSAEVAQSVRADLRTIKTNVLQALDNVPQDR